MFKIVVTFGANGKTQDVSCCQEKISWAVCLLESMNAHADFVALKGIEKVQPCEPYCGFAEELV